MKRPKYIKDKVKEIHDKIETILQEEGEDLRTKVSEEKAIAIALDWAIIEWIASCNVEGELWLNKMMERGEMKYNERMRILMIAEKLRKGEGTYEDFRKQNFGEGGEEGGED